MMDAENCLAFRGTPSAGDCSPNPCPPPPPPPRPEGACCRPTVCDIQLDSECPTLGGIFRGVGVACEPDPCAPPPCDLSPGPDADLEGEPPCLNGYNDEFNSGCNGGGWVELWTRGSGCVEVNGQCCTYTRNGEARRDEDWYFGLCGPVGTVTASCVAEFPVELSFVDGVLCESIQFIRATAAPCDTVSLSREVTPTSEFWVVVAPSVTEGIPRRNYRLTVCGLNVNNPVEETSWGAIKARYHWMPVRARSR
jgi:hypothetical protein